MRSVAFALLDTALSTVGHGTLACVLRCAEERRSDLRLKRLKRNGFRLNRPFRFSFLFEHDLFLKPVSTFRDHALARLRYAPRGCARQHGVELIALVVESGECRAGEHTAARQFDRHRIDEAIIDYDFEMHV